MTQKLTAEINQLQHALDRLKEGLNAQPTQLNKDATIQRFEFTFELLWKSLKTYIEESGRDAMPASPKDVFRVAADMQIIPDPAPYFEYLKKRNLSSHTYNEAQADEVYQAIKDFPQAVEKILTKIREAEEEQ